jgi:DNA polymerase III sliding clamp (beta) subunit (PCNA family)
MDVLKHIDTDEIALKVESSDGPGLVFPDAQEEDEELLMLIMPVRLN